MADLSVRKTVGELLFEGYDDPLIGMGKSMENFQNLELPPFDKFGWFYMVRFLNILSPSSAETKINKTVSRRDLNVKSICRMDFDVVRDGLQ